MYKNQITGKVTELKRLPNSPRSSAPNWQVTILAVENRVNPDAGVIFVGDDFTARTSIGAMLSYAIGNKEFREEAHTFELTPAGRISGRYEKA